MTPDRVGLAGRLAPWLSELLTQTLAADDLVVSAPSSGGWSNETYLVRMPGHAVVVRLQPERASMFPRYDLGRQLWCLERLGTVSDVPTPAVLGADLAGERLGRPAFVMELIEGRIPSDDTPTFAESGWLRDATPSEQRRFHCGLLDAMAAVHRVDVDTDGRRLLAPSTGADRRGALNDLADVWAFDQGVLTPPGIDQAFAELADALTGAAVDRAAVDRAAVDRAPVDSAAVLLWGDARPANVVVANDGFEPIGLLDWELASIGPPELDVLWLEEMNWMRIEGSGWAPLPGFLPADEAIEHYESRTGRRLAELEWHRRFAALRVAVLMHRYLRGLVHAGRLEPDHRLFTDTVASRRLAELWD